MKRFFKKNFGRTLFLSYALLLILSLTALLMQMRSSLAQLEQSTEQFSRIALNQVSDSLERAYADILGQMDQVHSRQEYTSLVYADADLSSYKLLKVGKLEDEMVRLVSYSGAITRMYVWFEHPQVAATTSGFLRTAEAFDRALQRDLNITLEEVETLARGNGLTFFAIGPAGSRQKLIAVLASGKSADPERGWTTIEILELDRSVFFSPLDARTAEGYTTEFWAVTPEGSLLADSAQVAALAANVKEKVLEPDAVSRIPFEDTDYAVMGTTTRYGLAVYSAADFTLWSRTQSQYRTTVLVYCAVYLLVGLGVAFLFSRRNSQPVERLSSLISEKLSDYSQEGDLASLEAGINSLLRYWQDYASARGRQERQQTEQNLYDLLSGKLGEQEYREIIERHGVHFPSEQFAVAGISLRSLTGGFLDGKAPDDRKTLEIARFAIGSVAGELLGERGAAYTCRHEDRIWVLVCPVLQKGATEKEITEQLMDCLTRAEVFLREQIGIETAAYLSRFISQWNNIPTAFREAVWGLEQIESYSIPGALFDFPAVEKFLSPDDKNRPVEDNSEKRRSFFSAVVAGDFEEARRLYLELRRQDLAFADESFGAIRVQTSILLGYLVSNLPPEYREAHSQEIESYVIAVRMERHDQQLTDLMCRWMREFHRMYREAQGEAREEKTDVAQNAVSYINDHFADREVSVASVAESLGVSPSYLSRVFRKKYELSVLDYIHRRRIETAKLLLRESDLTVENVANQVGYANALALIRTFRKTENCTPTEYRKSLKQGL